MRKRPRRKNLVAIGRVVIDVLHHRLSHRSKNSVVLGAVTLYVELFFANASGTRGSIRYQLVHVTDLRDGSLEAFFE